MEFFRDSRIEFMKYRRYFVVLSTLFVLVGILAVFVQGNLNMGIDFVGGTQLTLRFREQPQIEQLRQILEGAGVSDAQIQRFGEEELNEVMIKTSLVEGSEEGSREQVIGALSGTLDPGISGKLDLNQSGVDRLTSLLLEADPDGVGPENRAHYEGVASRIDAVRKERGLISAWDELSELEGISQSVLSSLHERAGLGQFAVLASENVGPLIGAELRKKGVLAVGLSLIGMLLYIWYRFELRFGVGALVALVHDVVVVLGLFAILNYEFNLTTIAAFLTLVGYSVNDSVVVFDRVRENLRRARREPLESVLNLSINQTLSRTALTSGTTILAVGTLFLFGGDVLRGFSFVLLTGVVVGTYSSIFVASPITLVWESWFAEKRKARRRRA